MATLPPPRRNSEHSPSWRRRSSRTSCVSIVSYSTQRCSARRRCACSAKAQACHNVYFFMITVCLYVEPGPSARPRSALLSHCATHLTRSGQWRAHEGLAVALVHGDEPSPSLHTASLALRCCVRISMDAAAMNATRPRCACLHAGYASQHAVVCTVLKLCSSAVALCAHDAFRRHEGSAFNSPAPSSGGRRR